MLGLVTSSNHTVVISSFPCCRGLQSSCQTPDSPVNWPWTLNSQSCVFLRIVDTTGQIMIFCPTGVIILNYVPPTQSPCRVTDILVHSSLHCFQHAGQQTNRTICLSLSIIGILGFWDKCHLILPPSFGDILSC